MRKTTTTLVLSLLANFCFSQKTPKALLVLVDGIPADVIEKTYTPHLDQISKEGGYTRAYVGGEKGQYSQTPTISAVSYNTMLTGTWINKHNVWGNDIKEPNYNYWTIFRFLKESQPQKKLAIYSTWQDNRTKLLGEGLAQTNNLKLNYSFDGLELDKKRFPHDSNSDYINKIDEEVVHEAVKGIKENAPDLSWVYLQYTDDMGHKFGADTKEMQVAIQKADRQIGNLYQAIEYRQQYYDEDWMMVIVTDHGRDAATGLHHGGQTERERTIWMSTNKNPLNKYFYASTPAMVDILPSVARHLGINIPKIQAYELDGVPFVGEISITSADAKIEKQKLLVTWTPFTATGKVNIWVTTTNQFKTTGEPDIYQNLGRYDTKSGKAEIMLQEKLSQSRFFKIVIEGEHNSLNRWVVR